MNCMAEKIFNLIIISMCVSSISITLTRGSPFSFLRNWAYKRSKWFGALLSCTYCTSHWVAIVIVILVYIYNPIVNITNILFIDAAITVFAVVAISTIITGIVVKKS